MEIIIPVILIGILLGLLIGIICSIVAGTRSKNRWSKLGYWLLTIMLSALPTMFFVALSFPSNTEKWIYGSAYTLVELLLFLIIFRWIRRPAGWVSYLTILICFCAGTGMYYHYQGYVKSLAVIRESSDLLWQYNPVNKNNTLSTLEAPATLALTDDLPVLDGATALYPVYAAFANAVYPAKAISPLSVDTEDSGITFAIQSEVLLCSTTAKAYQNLVDGEADIIFVAGPSDAQLQYAADKGEEMVFTPIGRECFVFFVNAQNPVNGLTVDQLRGIYSGEITDWKSLGADIGKIRPFQRDEGSGSQSTLVRFMNGTPLMEPEKENLVGGMGGIIERTADYRNFPNAIGYSFRFYSTEMVQNGEIKLLEINGIAPTKENILNDTYPISDSFFAVTLASNDNPNVPPLIDWILSAQGQALIDRTGYVAIQ